MKTPLLLLIAVALPGIHGVCHAQSPVQEVIDNALIQQSMSSTQDIMGLLQQQLTEAQKQTQSLTDQLSRMGNPAEVTLPALTMIKEDISKSAENATSNAMREERIRATTGAEAFGDNAYGLVTPVNATVTLKDGTTAERDEAKYKLHGAVTEDLNEMAQVSLEADERIAALEQQRGPLLDQVSTSKDLATVIKFQVALQQIDAQIVNIRAGLAKQMQDHTILQEKLQMQAQVLSKATAETRDLERKNTAAKKKASTPSSSTGSSSSGSAFSNLQWGKTSGGTTP